MWVATGPLIKPLLLYSLIYNLMPLKLPAAVFLQLFENDKQRGSLCRQKTGQDALLCPQCVLLHLGCVFGKLKNKGLH